MYHNQAETARSTVVACKLLKSAEMKSQEERLAGRLWDRFRFKLNTPKGTVWHKIASVQSNSTKDRTAMIHPVAIWGSPTNTRFLGSLGVFAQTGPRSVQPFCTVRSVPRYSSHR